MWEFNRCRLSFPSIMQQVAKSSDITSLRNKKAEHAERLFPPAARPSYFKDPWLSFPSSRRVRLYRGFIETHFFKINQNHVTRVARFEPFNKRQTFKHSLFSGFPFESYNRYWRDATDCASSRRSIILLLLRRLRQFLQTCFIKRYQIRIIPVKPRYKYFFATSCIWEEILAKSVPHCELTGSMKNF